jgi:hypothetical protein
LQRTSRHADDFGDFFSAFSPLYKVGGLPHSFWCKLCWSSVPLSKALYRLMGIHGLCAQSIRKGQTLEWRPFFCRRERFKSSRAGHIAFITGGDEGAAASRRGYKGQRAWILLSRDKNLSVRASCHGISTRG